MHFDEVKLHFWDYKDFTVQRLTEIFKKFQGSIKKISIGFSAISYACLINLLQLLPNLYEIVIDLSLIGTSPKVEQRLSNLIRLKSVTTRVETATIILELPNNVLSKLIFKSSVCEVAPSKQLIEMIFLNQIFIEELNFNPEKVNSIESLALKKLWLATNHNIESLMQNQQHLTSLFMLGNLNCKELPNLSCLNNLHTLQIRIDNKQIEAAFLCNVNLMKNLKVLIIELSNYDFKLNNISLLSLEMLEMNFQFYNENIVAFLENLPAKCPHLKKLQLRSSTVVIDSHVMSSLLENKNLKNLQLLIAGEAINLRTFTIDIHENLKEICLEYNAQQFERLIKLCPNLEKLSVWMKDLKPLKNILKNKNLTHLRFKSNKQITVISNDLIRIINGYGKNLNYFELRCNGIVVDNNFDSKLKRACEAQFSKIEFSCKDSFLIMRNKKWD